MLDGTLFLVLVPCLFKGLEQDSNPFGWLSFRAVGSTCSTQPTSTLPSSRETPNREHQETPPCPLPTHHPPHLHPEAHRMHAPLQERHCQCPLAVPQAALPPLEHEVVEERAVVQVMQEAEVSFKDLVQLPI